MTSRRIFLLGVLVLGLFFPGLSRSADPGPGQPQILNLDPSQSLGQTFLSRYRGLNGIEVFLSPASTSRGKAVLKVRENPDSTRDLLRSELTLPPGGAPGFYLLPFFPLRDSRGKGYYLELSREGTGPLGVGVNPGDGYYDGSLYRDGTPQNLQLAFRLRYDRTEKALGLLGEGTAQLPLLGLALWLLVLPGWALLYLWPGHRGLAWTDKLGLALGLSVALYPLLLLWTRVLGIRLGAGYAWIPPVCGLAAILWRNRGWRPARIRSAWSSWVLSPPFWADLAILVSIGLVFIIRLYVVRLLDYPLWGDSLHHTMIVRLLADHGGLFDSWEPYASLKTFTYHFGFHAAAAAFHWTGGTAIPRTVLDTGQILNGAAVLALMPLARLLAPGRWAALGAVLTAGLLTPMPMVYLNWGRYTQLAGQVILPTVVFFLWKLLEDKEAGRRDILITGLALAGLALAHYRAAWFAPAFAAAFVLVNFSRQTLKNTALRVIPAAAVSAVLFFPWFWHVFSGKIFRIFGDQITTPAGGLTAWEKAHNAIGPLSQYLPPFLWLALALIVVWGLLVRSRGVALVVLWWVLVVLSANPDWIGLPGTGLLNSFTVFIAVYIPAGLLAGFLIGRAAEGQNSRGLNTLPALICFLVFSALGAWGTGQRVAEVNRKLSLQVTGPDLRAAQWIREHTTPGDRFMVNAVPAYDGSVVVGVDAGGWLPLTAGRKTSLPPLLYVTEKGPDPDFEPRTLEILREMEARGPDPAEFARTLARHGYTHLYVGQSVGRLQIGAFSADPARLGAGPWFQPLYHRDRVWVFRVGPDPK